MYHVSGGLASIDQVGAGPTEYIRASGMTLARVAGAAVTWLHPDHLGSAVAGTGAAGSVVWRESEQPFGEDWISAPANDNQPGYTGHVEDAATGLVYMQARYYDPVIGRFLANDPVGFSPQRPDMFNRYAYAANDPVNAVDPDGLQAAPCPENCIQELAKLRYKQTENDPIKDNANNSAAEVEGDRLAQQHNASSANDPKYHEYSITTKICNSGSVCNVEVVLERLLEITPPQDLCNRSVSSCSGPGRHSLFGIGPFDDNPIVSWRDGTATGNDTLPGHMFHYGQVIHQAYEFEGGVYVHTLGTGTGGFKELNNLMGSILIGPTHGQLIEEFHR